MTKSIMSFYSNNIAIFIIYTALLSGCSPVGDDNGVSETTTCPGVHPIESSQDAKYVAANIIYLIEDAVNDLPEGTYRQHEVEGYFGVMEVTGVVSRSVNESCGTECIARYNDHDVIASMSNYASATAPTVVTGVINYSDTTGVHIINGDSSAIGVIAITDNAESIFYKRTYIIPECDRRENGVEDRIVSINSSGSSSSSNDQSGSLVSVGGEYFF